MITCSVLILFVTFGITRNLALSCLLSGGYFASVGAGSVVIRKIGFPLWIRMAGQVVVAALILTCVGGFTNHGEAGEQMGNRVAADAAKTRSEATEFKGLPDEKETVPSTHMNNPSKEERVRDFALREAPEVWHTYEELGAAIKQQDKRLAELRKALELFDKSYADDAAYTAISEKRDAMLKSRSILKSKMEQAYIQSRKFAAAPQRRELDELRRKAIEEGTKEVESARARFDNLKREK